MWQLANKLLLSGIILVLVGCSSQVRQLKIEMPEPVSAPAPMPAPMPVPAPPPKPIPAPMFIFPHEKPYKICPENPSKEDLPCVHFGPTGVPSVRGNYANF